MLHAQAGRMELHLVDRVKVAKHQVVTTALQPLLLLGQALRHVRAADILRHVERSFLCFTVSIDLAR